MRSKTWHKRLYIAAIIILVFANVWFWKSGSLDAEHRTVTSREPTSRLALAPLDPALFVKAAPGAQRDLFYAAAPKRAIHVEIKPPPVSPDTSSAELDALNKKHEEEREAQRMLEAIRVEAVQLGGHGSHAVLRSKETYFMVAVGETILDRIWIKDIATDGVQLEDQLTKATFRALLAEK